MFEAGRQVADWSGAPWMQENPVTMLSSIPHIGKPDYYFHPWQYAALCEGDNYTKKTCIWGGNGFVMPEPCPAPHLGPPDNRIHFASPTDDRGDVRSAARWDLLAQCSRRTRRTLVNSRRPQNDLRRIAPAGRHPMKPFMMKFTQGKGSAEREIYVNMNQVCYISTDGATGSVLTFAATIQHELAYLCVKESLAEMGARPEWKPTHSSQESK